MNRFGNLILQIILIAAMAALISSCSAVNPESPLSLVDGNGNHFAGWIEDHGTVAVSDETLCMPCHGDDLDGGITSVSCSTASIGGQTCHANGPGLHPSDWLDKSSADFHALAYSLASNSCSLCHNPAQPANPPGYNCLDCHFSEDGEQREPNGSLYFHGDTTSDHQAFTGTDADVCVNCHTVNIGFANQASCHNCHDLATHDVPNLNHNLAVPDSNDFDSLCSTCHIINPPPISSAPVCISCHTEGNPYLETNCTSCHGQPPSSGEHSRHRSRASCSDCHQGAGSGSGLNHFYDGVADVVFAPTININYNGSSCTGDCHGEEHDDNW